LLNVSNVGQPGCEHRQRGRLVDEDDANPGVLEPRDLGSGRLDASLPVAYSAMMPSAATAGMLAEFSPVTSTNGK
jgi:hypothetical protein